MEKVVKKLTTSTSSTEYGIVGEATGVKIKGQEIHVGDAVLWHSNEYKTSGVTIVCKDEYGKYRMMGLFGMPLMNDQYKIIEIIVSHKNVTDEVLWDIRQMKFKTKTIKQITLDELRQHIPFEFELVEGK